jgi:hypothetical protein
MGGSVGALFVLHHTMLRLFKYPWASQGSNGQDTNVSNLKRNRSSDTVDLEEDATAVDSYVAEEPHPKRRKLAPAITNIPSYCESRDLDVFEAAKQQDREPDQVCHMRMLTLP